MAPNSKSFSASSLINLMHLKENPHNTNRDINNNILKTDDGLLHKQVHIQIKNETQNNLNKTDEIELKEINKNKVINSRFSFSFNNRQPQSSQQINHSKCNGVCVLTNEPKNVTCKQPVHRLLIPSQSNGFSRLNFLNQNQPIGNAFASHPNLNSNVLSSCSPLVPSYLSNSSKYTGYSTYGKLTHGAEHLPATSSLCINNLQTKTKIFNFKVVIVGEMASGKTSYIRKLTQPKNLSRNRYNYYMATKGVEAKCKLFEWDENTLVNLEFWDIGGQENYVQMADMFCRDAFGAILMFDASNKQSLDSLLKWKQSLDAAVRLIDNKPIPTVLVANKCDLDTESNWLMPDVLETFCKKNNILTFFYASVRRNVNLEIICYDLIAEMLIRYQRKEYKTFNNHRYQKKSLKKFQCSNCTIL